MRGFFLDPFFTRGAGQKASGFDSRPADRVTLKFKERFEIE